MRSVLDHARPNFVPKFVDLTLLRSAITCLLLLAGGTAFAAPVVDPDLLWQVGRGRPVPTGPEAAALQGLGASSTIEEDGERWLDVWMRGPISHADVHAAGALIGTQAGEWTTARVPARLVEHLLNVPGLEQIQLAQGLEPQLDRSVPEIGAPVIWGGSAPDFGTQTSTTTAGNGVIVGIVDIGLDTGHADLRTSSGTRFLALWDQTKTGVPPVGFTYGAEYLAAAINSGLYMPADLSGHGTHVASVAAGNARATAPSYTYPGVAPEADLVGVVLKANMDGSIPDTRVIEGADYVFRRAALLNKPAVVLVSLGKMSGPHDGSDPLDAGLSALTGTGKLMVAPAGNYNGSARHAEVTATASNQALETSVKIDPYTTSSLDENYFKAEGWYNSTTNFTVTVTTPSGATVGPVNRGSFTSLQTPSGFVRIENGTYTSSNGSFRTEVYVFRGGSNYPQIGSGNWRITYRSQTTGTNRVDSWITTYRVGGVKPIFVTGMTNKRLVTSPGNANNVLSVAAYSTKRMWTDINGQTRSFFDAVVNEIANFSSPGPRRDDAQYPHVAAPGYGVAGAKSAQASPSTTFILPGGKYWINYGTSVAAAHAAGGAALKLSLNRNLTPTTFINEIKGAAIGDSWADSLPSTRWGSGKLRLARTSTDVAYSGPRTFTMRSPYPNPTRGSMTVEFSLSETQSVPADGVRLRIVDVMGREVRTIPVEATLGTTRVRWDGDTDEGSRAAAGIYFARLEIGPSTAVEKFVLLD